MTDQLAPRIPDPTAFVLDDRTIAEHLAHHHDARDVDFVALTIEAVARQVETTTYLSVIQDLHERGLLPRETFTVLIARSHVARAQSAELAARRVAHLATQESP